MRGCAIQPFASPPPGQAGLLIVGETKVQAAVQKAVTRAEKQIARELNVDPKDVDKTLQQAVEEM